MKLKVSSRFGISRDFSSYLGNPEKIVVKLFCIEFGGKFLTELITWLILLKIIIIKLMFL